MGRQHTAPLGKGPSRSPFLPIRASRAAGKTCPEPCLFLERFNWFGEEVGLVKRDLTVGHRQFEGLRGKEREGLFPSSSPEQGPLPHKDTALERDLNGSPAGRSR